MSNAEYNEAQFEIEKAEAVKEARNAALEESAKIVERDVCSLPCTYHRECIELPPIAAAIRALKTLTILLPLLFVFGVAAGEPKSLNDALAADSGVRMALQRLQTARAAMKEAPSDATIQEYQRAFNAYIAAGKDIRAQWSSINASANPSKPARFSN